LWLLYLILLLVIYTFGPGMLLVRPLRLSRGERLVVAVGVGLFLDYLFSFAFFAFRLAPSTHVVTTIFALVLGVLAWRDWQSVLRSHQVRRMLWCWLCLLVWGFLLLSMIRHYGGGTWSGDWVEHLQRTAFFLESSNPDFTLHQTFLNELKYPVPMRPPMMNAITAGILAQAADAETFFEGYQLVFVFLNSLVALPCMLVAPRLVKLSPRLARKAVWTVAAALAASPMFCQNLTYAWTKLFAAFYAILAIAIYLRAWQRKNKADSSTANEDEPPAERAGRRPSTILSPPSSILRPSPARFVLAFALLCAGFLVHFSVGPYALFLGLHYLAAVWWRRPNRWGEAAMIGGVSLAVLATWFTWSVVVYGPSTTFTSTSAVSDSVRMSGAENVANIAKNVGNTLFPRILREPDLIRHLPVDSPTTVPSAPAVTEEEKIREDLEQPSGPGRVRDFFFLIYQVSLPGGLGSVGFALALVLLWMAWTRRSAANPGVRVFWIAFIPIVFIAGVAVYGGTDRFGVAHICLQPMMLLGICLVAGGVWAFGPRVRGLLLLGLLFDFVFGVFLQVTLEHHLFRLDAAPKLDAAGQQMVDREGQPLLQYSPARTHDVPSRSAQFNLVEKVAARIQFWGDRFPDPLPLQLAMGGLLSFLLFKGLLGPRGRRIAVSGNATTPSEKPRRPGKSRGGKSRRS
jgi:hypothetical protein